MDTLTDQLAFEVERAIARLRAHPRARQVLDGTAAPDLLARYYHSAHRIVRHAPRLLRRSADVLHARAGHPELIVLFERKAEQEAGHERWLERDLSALGYPLAQLDALSAPPAASLYNSFHDQVIGLRGEAFLGTAWILESLAVRCAGGAVDKFRSRAAFEAGLSFLRAHAEEDRSHVAELLELIGRCVIEPPAQDYVRLCAEFTGSLYPEFFAEA
jgi:pyrroloquinoline quinone (PQQ) biosynthesis protein C